MNPTPDVKAWHTHGEQTLRALGAPPRLVQHGHFVGHTAAGLVTLCQRLNIPVDGQSVVIGAWLHDVGKIKHPEELQHPGHKHELAGFLLLQKLAWPPTITRKAITHATHDHPDFDLSDLLVALADKLWKGKRHPTLEQRLIQQAAHHTGQDFWTLEPLIDQALEALTDHATTRLINSNRP